MAIRARRPVTCPPDTHTDRASEGKQDMKLRSRASGVFVAGTVVMLLAACERDGAIGQASDASEARSIPPSPIAQDQPQSPELATRVTNAYPAFSPDGRWIAYMSNADGDFDIYVMNLTTGVRHQLTDAMDRDGTPAWSPDGTQIAFQSFRDGHSQVYVMERDGTNQRNLSRSLSHDEHPFWTADGQRLVFASNRPEADGEEGNIDLYSMSAEGGDVLRITSTPEVETYPTLSPDGSRIACRRIMADGNWEVVVMDADGRNAQPVAPHEAVDGWPAWSPDGTRLAFASARAGSSDLYVLDLATNELHQITFDEERDDRQPWWSPDGRMLAFSRYMWFPNQPFYEAAEIYVLRVE